MKFMEKKWISTVELLNYLKEHPNKEKECRLNLGYGLGSTHYLVLGPRDKHVHALPRLGF